MVARLSLVVVLGLLGACSHRHATGSGQTSDPSGNPQPRCGDGIKNGSETCDGSDFGNATCTDFAFTAGSLHCSADCTTIDPAGCAGRVAGCGNGVVEGFESCDGTTFRADIPTCEDLGGTGTIACKDDCQVDYSGCQVQDICSASGLVGNQRCDACDLLGGAEDPDCIELCDAGSPICADYFDFAHNVWTCEHAGGNPNPACGQCGNGVVEGNEMCDRGNLNGGHCSDWGYVGGTLACRPECVYDFTNCNFDVCGDGVIGTSEACDGNNLGDNTCVTFGYDNGALACKPDCSGFDVSSCRGPAVCGDGEKTGPEKCDGADLGGATCASLGFQEGTLACSAQCNAFDVSGCHGIVSCGNGHRDALEFCDGTDFGPAGDACTNFGLGPGHLHCTAQCAIDTSGCGAPDLCKPYGWYNNGWCDACDAMGGTTDSECATRCVADGWCADHFDTLTGTWTCTHAGLLDPDCGVCGNGVLDGNELCDGTRFVPGKNTCAAYGYSGGTLSCRPDCIPNFAACIR